ncbi:MAG: site-2 protease family protein, partial [Vulcanimicrobiaceae bacterium]
VIVLVSALTFGVSSLKAQPVVGQIVQGSPADLAGLRPGDRIVRIGSTEIASGTQLVTLIHSSLNKPLDVIFSRNGSLTERNITPKACPPNQPAGSGCIGFAPVPQYVRVGIADAFSAANAQYATIAQNTVGSITMLVTHFTKYAPQVSGVVGMGQAAATIQDFGWGPYLGLAATISFALGLFNLLPLPALDGGRGVFIIAELLRGKPVDPEKEAYVHIAGFALLMGLMVVIAAHDIARIASGQGVF